MDSLSAALNLGKIIGPGLSFQTKKNSSCAHTVHRSYGHLNLDSQHKIDPFSMRNLHEINQIKNVKFLK